jgi:hypothetical protein
VRTFFDRWNRSKKDPSLEKTLAALGFDGFDLGGGVEIDGAGVEYSLVDRGVGALDILRWYI